MAKKRRTPLGASALDAISAKIDRKKMSLRQQTLRAERMMKETGIDRQAAMTSVAREQIASQSRSRVTAPGPRTKKKFVPSGRPKRDPFARQRRLDPKKITRRGGRQPRKR